MAFSFIHLLSVLSFCICTLAFYEPNGPVVPLNPKTFDERIRKTDRASIVEFFAPWCGHCKNLAPAYTKAAEHMAGMFTFAAVDCDDQSNRALCAEFKVQGFPTIKLMKSYYGHLDSIDYQGPRTAKALTDFAKENMENFVVRVTDDTLSSFLENKNDSAKAILFTTKGSTSALYKSLAIDFKEQIALAQVRDTQKQVLKEFNVDKFPTFVLLPGGSAAGVVYSGKLERGSMFQFLSRFASTKGSSDELPEPKPKEQTKYKLDKISDDSELVENCFTTHGTCYLLLSLDEGHVKTFSSIAHRVNARNNMRIYAMDLLAVQMDFLEGTTLPPIIALNGGKGWYKKFEGQFLEEEVTGWMDAVKMGEGEKVPIRKDILSRLKGETSPEAVATSSTESIIESTPLAEDVQDAIRERSEGFHDEL